MGILKEQFDHGGTTKSGLLIDGVKQSKTTSEKSTPTPTLSSADESSVTETKTDQTSPKSEVAITKAEKV